MHMVDKWSYRLAEHCNDKGVRATYWYLRHECLVLVSKPLNYQQLLVCCTCCIVWPVCTCKNANFESFVKWYMVVGTNNLTIEHDTTEAVTFKKQLEFDPLSLIKT